MVEIEIDGKKTMIEDTASIIEAADAMGIYIPRFCYHKKLSVVANCRMCLVEVNKSGKPMPACATSVTAGMKVFTRSQKTIEAQRAVMEFLLINHPLDCPICDQGGECELQDLAMGFGRSSSNYDKTKRAVFSENIGPLVETEMTRCIQCTRCVRFGEEIAGLPELGVINRGEKEVISTYIRHFMQSELSGNIIDLCPVGALTDKPARYQGRGWEYHENAAIAPHDCVGGNIFFHTRWQQYAPQRTVMRAVPRENNAINETWMSDRDRFSHFGFYHESRIYQPRIKNNGKWLDVSWEKALIAIKTKIGTLIKKQGASQIGALTSSSATVEEYYLLQKWLRGLGSHNIDHRIRWQDFRDQNAFPIFPNLGLPIADIENLTVILLVGSNVRFEQPLINHRINKAYSAGAKILAINPVDYPFAFEINEKIIVSPQRLLEVLHMIISEKSHAIIGTLAKAEKAAIFLGEHALHHAEASEIRTWAYFIGEKCGASVGLLTEGGNSAGAWLVGAIPHRGLAGELLDSPGLDAKTMLTADPLKAYFLLNVEPELDSAYAAEAKNTLINAEFVVCLTTFLSSEMESYADILLPIAPFSESGGTFVNVEGRWQSCIPVSTPENDSQPAWKVFRTLGNLFGLPGFDYETLQKVQSSLMPAISNLTLARSPIVQNIKQSSFSQPSHPCENDGIGESFLMRLAPWPMFCVDNIVRRSQPLQETLADRLNNIRLNANTASRLNFMVGDSVTAIQGKSRVTLPLMIDERLADNTVLLFSGLIATAGFGQADTTIRLERSD
ncbi:NADH-quinone oxidoreductase subunit NuoG [Coxiella endosymbiont of Amblyomma nuttalli]|uniref:NADH-quinone oxidoreductase subunit NuoG n=1 Tax=Coxiella endosymbiont of Amblyomma nuttalli TaxID=2749996 RepID=UPI001BA4DF6D|nr:NADH-quinone oxidoreductase subunit NuoG [Coxiella endosymbiont of Amblyomma nuttalli]QTS83673.1 NADH-quinone oxidoreductase chain G [Coxiella endosymbiont of Amblyomma nuttalli]